MAVSRLRCNIPWIAYISLFLFLCSAADGQTPAQQRSPLPELWTQLLKPIDSSRLSPGDPLTVQAIQSWVYGTCGLNAEALVNGKVIDVSREPKTTSVSLRFEVQCQDGSQLPVVFIAAFHAPEKSESQMDLYNAMPSGIGAGATGRQSTDIGRLPSPGMAEERLPLAKFGEVNGIRHLTLTPPAVSRGATELRTTERKLRLPAFTRFVFVPVVSMGGNEARP